MISVIIPLYNKEKAIQNTLLSVLKQTYSDFEIIVVDDGGTDNSANIVKEISKLDNRINYFYKHNGGVSSARNYGLSKAKGEWIIFLDADDEMLPNNLKHLYDLVSNNNINIASANIYIQSSNNDKKLPNLKLKNKAVIYHNYILATISRQAIFSTGAVIFKRNILGTNPYNESLCRYEDAEFELKLFNKQAIIMSPTAVLIHHEEFSELSKTRHHDTEKDFIFNMNFKEKTFWQKVQMGRFICEGCHSYSKENIKQTYGFNYYWQYIYILIRKFYSLKNKMLSLLRNHPKLAY